MELNELEKIRVEKLEKMRAQGLEPYPTRSDVTQQVSRLWQLLLPLKKPALAASTLKNQPWAAGCAPCARWAS